MRQTTTITQSNRTMSNTNVGVGDTVVDTDGYEYRVCDVDGDYVGYVDEYGQLKYTSVERVKNE